jgi:serine/threonine protein kinase
MNIPGRAAMAARMPSMKASSDSVLAGYVLESLREDVDFTIYRGRRRGSPSPIIVVTLAAEQPSAQSLRRLEHEYSLAADLDPAWAASPLELTRHEGRTILVLNDPGGELLDRVLERDQGQPLNLTRFLRIAIGLTKALGQVHQHGLIHKDIKPANVLVDDADNVFSGIFGQRRTVWGSHGRGRESDRMRGRSSAG